MIKLTSLEDMAANIGALQANVFIHKQMLKSIDRLLDSFHDGDLIKEKVYEILKREVVDAVEYFDEYEDIVNNSMIKQLGCVASEVLAYEISNR